MRSLCVLLKIQGKEFLMSKEKNKKTKKMKQKPKKTLKEKRKMKKEKNATKFENTFGV